MIDKPLSQLIINALRQRRIRVNAPLSLIRILKQPSHKRKIQSSPLIQVLRCMQVQIAERRSHEAAFRYLDALIIGCDIHEQELRVHSIVLDEEGDVAGRIDG